MKLVLVTHTVIFKKPKSYGAVLEGPRSIPKVDTPLRLHIDFLLCASISHLQYIHIPTSLEDRNTLKICKHLHLHSYHRLSLISS